MSIKEIINDNYTDLSDYEKKVANKILDGKLDPINTSITQASKICGVSVSLISKFCVKIGVSGWKTLRSLGFIDLRSKKTSDNPIIGEHFNLLQNSFVNRSDYINKFLKSLYNKIDGAKKIIVFGNGSTKMIANIMAHKWNKLGGNMIVYDYVESYVSIMKGDIVIYLTISGNNNKIGYYQKQNSSNNEYLITFGRNKSFTGKALELDIYKQFSKIEKSFPLITDVFMQFLLNKLIELKLNNTVIIKRKISELKIREV